VRIADCRGGFLQKVKYKWYSLNENSQGQRKIETKTMVPSLFCSKTNSYYLNMPSGFQKSTGA
jgi:hypothetical protein